MFLLFSLNSKVKYQTIREQKKMFESDCEYLKVDMKTQQKSEKASMTCCVSATFFNSSFQDWMKSLSYHVHIDINSGKQLGFVLWWYNISLFWLLSSDSMCECVCPSRHLCLWTCVSMCIYECPLISFLLHFINFLCIPLCTFKKIIFAYAFKLSKYMIFLPSSSFLHTLNFFVYTLTHRCTWCSQKFVCTLSICVIVISFHVLWKITFEVNNRTYMFEIQIYFKRKNFKIKQDKNSLTK